MGQNLIRMMDKKDDLVGSDVRKVREEEIGVVKDKR